MISDGEMTVFRFYRKKMTNLQNLKPTKSNIKKKYGTQSAN